MSSIVGTYWLNGRPADDADLRRMLATMPHRSVDGSWVWNDGRIGLGHGLLQRTPEAIHDIVPATRRNGALRIVADARIDNRSDLLRLLFPSRPPESVSDSAIILAAYERWGEKCPEHLLGAFAFAIWDDENQKLFCARDHLGVRPFYYAHQRRRFFAFATEIKALLQLDDVSEMMSEPMLAYYIVGAKTDKELTIYEDVLRLPPACRLTVTRQGLRVEPYWTLELPDELHLGSDEAYAERFAEIFEEAVRCRLRSSAPVGAHLSGGLDSSYVACVARDQLLARGERLHTYSLTFNSIPSADESRYIQAVVREGGIVPHFVSCEHKGPLTDLDRIYSILDDGLVGGNYISSWELLLAAQETGVGTVLDGLDGDSTVEHGYGIFRTLARSGDWDGFMRETSLGESRLMASGSAGYRAIGERFRSGIYHQYALPHLKDLADRGNVIRFLRDAREVSRRFRVPFRMLVGRYWRRAVAPIGWVRRRDEVRETSPFDTRFIRSDFAARISLDERLREMENPHRDHSQDMRERQLRLHQSGKRTRVLEMADHLAAACGVELRHPFWDIRLIEYCLSLPERQSFNEGWTRIVMRRAMNGTVPDEVTWRVDKAQMSDFFRKGILERDGKRVERILEGGSMLEAYVDMDAVRSTLSRSDSISEQELADVSSILILKKWIDQRFGAAESTSRQTNLHERQLERELSVPCA